jgi:HEPN domain-containing protein
MQNNTLVKDHLLRASNRLAAVDTLFEKASWPDVVRESQEIVELALKGLLRAGGIEVPRVHDVSGLLLQHRDLLPSTLQPKLKKLAEISKSLRRDRELAFYGSDDLTPSEFYLKEDAETARATARLVVEEVCRALQFDFGTENR